MAELVLLRGYRILLYTILKSKGEQLIEIIFIWLHPISTNIYTPPNCTNLADQHFWLVQAVVKCKFKQQLSYFA